MSTRVPNGADASSTWGFTGRTYPWALDTSHFVYFFRAGEKHEAFWAAGKKYFNQPADIIKSTDILFRSRPVMNSLPTISKALALVVLASCAFNFSVAINSCSLVVNNNPGTKFEPVCEGGTQLNRDRLPRLASAGQASPAPRRPLTRLPSPPVSLNKPISPSHVLNNTSPTQPEPSLSSSLPRAGPILPTQRRLAEIAELIPISLLYFDVINQAESRREDPLRPAQVGQQAQHSPATSCLQEPPSPSPDELVT
ncbi:hypothetical protein PtB15_16B71 [Puccinia triticina]|nr:hypothetical protein PtB15_16B71 [Puccinia triticina]